MFKTIITLAAVVASSAALAADLPSRSPASAPVFAQTSNPWYVGARAGSTYKDEVANWTAGVNGGYEVHKYARVEVGYDRFNDKNVSNNKQDVVIGNVIAQYPIFLSITPYAVAGVGYSWSGLKDEAVYNVGAGVRYDLTKNLEVDARYRYISNFDSDRTNNAFTAGVNYKF
mgnify:CR=1 FL=1